MIWFEKANITHAQMTTAAAEIRTRRRSSVRWSMTGMRPSDVRGGRPFLRRNLVTTGSGQVVGCEPGARKRDGAREPAVGAAGPGATEAGTRRARGGPEREGAVAPPAGADGGVTASATGSAAGRPSP